MLRGLRVYSSWIWKTMTSEFGGGKKENMESWKITGQFSHWRKEPPAPASAQSCITWRQTVHDMKAVSNTDKSRKGSGKLVSMN